MSEHTDDTTEGAAGSRPARHPGDYYYDDATGYEVYRPGEEAEQEADEDTDAPEPDAGRRYESE